MKKAAVVLLGLAFCLCILAKPVFAAEKFGYVDLSRIFSEYGKTKDYDKSLADKQTGFENDLSKMENDIKKFQDKLNLLSDKEKESKGGELENKIKAYKDFKLQKGADLQKEQNEKMKEILKDIEEAVKQYAEKESYTMVFNDRVLVYEAKSLDITDKIIEIINKSYKKS